MLEAKVDGKIRFMKCFGDKIILVGEGQIRIPFMQSLARIPALTSILGQSDANEWPRNCTSRNTRPKLAPTLLELVKGISKGETMRITAVFLALASIGCLQTASAATITAYNRVTFQTALSGATLLGQNFDALPLGVITTVNGVTYTPSGGSALVTNSYLTTTSPNGLGSTSVGFFRPTESLTIDFSTPISAFAIDINTFAQGPGAYTATLNDGSNSVVSSIFDVFPNTSTGEFFGFTDSSPFSSVTISAATGFSYTVDTLVYGNASAITGTPEPSSIILLATGLLGAVGSVRSKFLA